MLYCLVLFRLISISDLLIHFSLVCDWRKNASPSNSPAPPRILAMPFLPFAFCPTPASQHSITPFFRHIKLYLSPIDLLSRTRTTTTTPQCPDLVLGPHPHLLQLLHSAYFLRSCLRSKPARSMRGYYFPSSLSTSPSPSPSTLKYYLPRRLSQL